MVCPFCSLGEVAQVRLTRGATSIRTENGQLAVYIFVDIRDRDLGGYVADAQRAVASQVVFRPAPTPSGAGSSSTSNARRRGCRSWCHSRF